MYFWNSYPFVRFTIALIFGILFHDHCLLESSTYLLILGASGTAYFSLMMLLKLSEFRYLKLWLGLSAVISIAAFGALLAQGKYHEKRESHYQNHQLPVRGFAGTIVSVPNDRTNHYRYDLAISTILSDTLHKSTGITHLYIRKDSAFKGAPLTYGDQVLVKGYLQEIPSPDNPEEFNYKKFLERQNIFAHCFTTYDAVKCIGNKPYSRLLKWAYQLRRKAALVIQTHISSAREQGVAEALILGIKDHLDNEIKSAYSSSGAMHVLAVSGLHVGIIYMVIQFIFQFLRKNGKLGRWVFALLAILLIWMYAIITGLSPSVLRASTMFSMMAIGQVMVKGGNIYNTLGIAAFILLLFDPYFIYSVGFQLSFIAVFGIVYLQPKIYQIIDIQYIVLDKIWSISAVSIAAQLATFPLSAYYFHQFPVYFLVSNLIVIPAATVMVMGGILLLISELIYSGLAKIIGFLLEQLIFYVNEILSLMEVLPFSLITWIYINRTELILIYVLIILGVGSLHFRSFKTLICFGICYCLLMSSFYHRRVTQAKQSELIFYEIKDKLAIDFVDGHTSTLFLDQYDSGEHELLSFQIDPFRLASGIEPIENTIVSLDSIFKIGDGIAYGSLADNKLFVFDSTTFHLQFNKVISTDILVINHNAVKSLSWLTSHFSFKKIILANTNSYYYRQEMKEQASALSIEIHDLKSDGALRLALKQKKSDRINSTAPFTTNPD